ncbi:MAG: prolyl oligopeptidase family serine peptidase [Gemmatimonadales bacterium]
MRRLTAALALLAGAAPLAAQGRAFTPQDWYRLSTLSSPAVSPDGRWVAFTVTTVRESENKRHSEVWMVGTAPGSTPMRMTTPNTESSNPRWSPDGKLLLFGSSRPPAKGRTWALRMDQPTGEAFEVDSIPDGSFTADGRIVAYGDTAATGEARDSSRSRGPFDRMQPMARPPYDAITRPLDPARFDGRHITDLGYKFNGRGFIPGAREAPRDNPAQIWTRPVAGGEKKQLTNTAYSHRNITISPDGQWIAFVADARLRPDSLGRLERDSLQRAKYDPKASEAPRNDADVFVIPVSGGEPRRLTTATGSEGSLAWSPDGSKLAYSSQLTRTGSDRIWVIDAKGGAPVNVLGDWKYEPNWFRWLPDGRILMGAAIGGRDAIMTVDPATKAIKEVVGGRRRLPGTDSDPAARTLAYVASSVTQPWELYVAGADGSGERKLTGFNDALNKEIAWPEAERFTYTSVGGLEIEAWLQKPYGYEPGKKYPLVFYIHGGPHSAYGENWFDEFHSITGAGMWVLFTNPRGSSGYGSAFTYSTRGRWGLEDYQDLMKAVDIAAKRPDVDSTRMGVTGGSYGGFMTAWVTSHTTRFKAAEADRMISNWWSWWGVSDVPGLTEFEFYGMPWERPALYDSLSPIRHVNKVRTPTLIVQSEEDHRTPMADAEQWFVALQKNKVPVEFVRYPRSTHDLSRTGEPWLLVDRLGRLRQWFGYWLKDEKPGNGRMAAGN